ncbi:MAG: YafY family transcriptional regulator [Bacteroidetes bacterium]|nr:YafY family transcriptional regulator [Bacteroidota bacterium]
MNRIDRVTAILIQLQSKKVVKAQEIADRFNISLRTVYRDINTLEEAGIPIIGEAGVGYSIMEGYRLPPVMFTKEEATAFLTAEKFIEQFTDASTSAQYQSAMYKIKAVLRGTEKDTLENMNDRIQVVKPYIPFNKGSVDNVLQILIHAISDKHVLKLKYQAWDTKQPTERHIEPIGVFFASDSWHAIAFCRLRNDYRDFRVDRIKGISTTVEQFTTEHPSLKEYLEKVYKDRELTTAVIRIHKDVAKYLGRQKHSHGFVLEVDAGDYMEMTFLSQSIEGLARWYLMFADYSEILQPQSLKDTVNGLIKKYFSNLEK